MHERELKIFEKGNLKGHPRTPRDALEQLEQLCKEQGLTLYLSERDRQGRRIYRIKELPSFKATFEAII